MTAILLLLACTPSHPTVDSAGPVDSAEATEEEPPITGGVEADPLFDPAVLHEVEITIDPEDWEALRVQDRSIYDFLGDECLTGPWGSPYDWFSADVVFDGENLGEVGLRKKGLLGSLSRERPSFKIDVDREDAEARFHGLEKLVLNNGNQDPGRLRTCLAHDWFADAGLIAPRCALAHVVVNGEDLGVYAHTENIDEEMIARRIGARPVEMYEGALSDFDDEFIVTFESETDTSTGAALIAVKDALTASDADLLARLDEVLDLPAFFTFWAAESIAGHWDGYNGNANNFYAWTDPSTGKLRFTASGPDAAFDSETPFGAGRPNWIATASRLSSRIWATEEGHERYLAEVERQLDEVWDEEGRLAELDAFRDLVGAVDDANMREGMRATRDVINGRETSIRADLGERFDLQPLRTHPCWVSIGSVEVEFRTTFGSYPSGDLYTGGEATTEYIINGDTYPSTQDGVSAGYSDERTALWLTISELAPDTWVAPYLTVDRDLVADGAEIAIDGHGAEAALLLMDPSTGGQWQTAAYLAGGTLTLERASTEVGEEWVGVLSTNVMGSAE